MLQVRRHSQVTFLHSEVLDRIPRIVHAFSTRRGDRNDFTLGPPSSPNPIVQMNRARFVASIGAPGWPIIKLNQVHSGTVCDIDDTSAAGEAVEGDAAITALQGVILSIQTADCVPILVADSEARAVAAIHAGWRGTAAHIAETTVLRLMEKCGVDGKSLAVVTSEPARVTLWDISSRQKIGAFQHTNSSEGVAFSPDGHTLAVGTWPGSESVVLIPGGFSPRHPSGSSSSARNTWSISSAVL